MQRPLATSTAARGSEPNSSSGHARGTLFANDAAAFFGDGGIAKPVAALNQSAKVSEPHTALIAATPVMVGPGASVRVQYMFGYRCPISSGRTKAAAELPGLDELAARARQLWIGPIGTPALSTRVAEAWAPRLVNASLETAPWLSPEMSWHSFYTQSAVTYDRFFEKHIIDQGTAYRYNAGFQGAIRDPLQHGLGLLHTRPKLVRDILLYSIHEFQLNFSAIDNANPVGFPDSMIGSGVIRPRTPRPDDFEVYLMLAASEYVLATRDLEFLSVKVSRPPISCPLKGGG